MSILILCPSYGRPENAARMYDSFMQMSVAGSKLLFVLDQYDESARLYRDVPTLSLPESAGGNMVERTNAALKYVDASVFGWMGDDMMFRTFGWDSMVLDAEAEHPVVYVNDLQQQELKATSVFVSRSVVRKLGWLLPPWSVHLYVDDAWVRLSERLGGIYLPEPVIEHMHPYVDKAEWDDTYRLVNTPTNDAHDGGNYQTWLTGGGLEKDVERVKR